MLEAQPRPHPEQHLQQPNRSQQQPEQVQEAPVAAGINTPSSLSYKTVRKTVRRSIQ
jgi:hypothetical protein